MSVGGVAFQEQLRDDVSRLAGETELMEGVTLEERRESASRAATRAYLKSRFDGMGLTGLEHAYGRDGANVYAEVPATNGSEEWIIVGAHFDAVGPGAADNATGTAMVLALANYVGSIACRESNVLFVLFDQEEIGLFGSAAFANLMLAEVRDVTSVHTIDMVSWDSDGDRLLEIHLPDEDLFDWYVNANDSANLGMILANTEARSSDHTSFRTRGFVSVGIMEGWRSGDSTPHYHTDEDTYDKVDFEYLEVATQLLMEMLRSNVALVD